jgi:hypothetical protein
MTITYLTGVSTPLTRESERTDLGLLATPASGIYAQRDHYDVWAADNAMFTAELVTVEQLLDGYVAPEEQRWLNWIEKLDPEGALWVTLPDVVGDMPATWARSIRYIDHVRELGFKVAIVLQDGIEDLPLIWGRILERADAIFIGGTTDWKLGDAAARLVAEAKARGLAVHMGRVNSLKRLRYAKAIGCDTADGTYIGFAPKVNAPKVEKWLTTVNDDEQLPLAV